MAERVVERTLSDGGLSIHYRLERLGGDLLLTVTGMFRRNINIIIPDDTVAINMCLHKKI